MSTTICILSYNRPEFLARCLRSIHETTTSEELEIIVHDDGSKLGGDVVSGARDVILAGLEADRISTAILNPAGHNQGQGTALNRMFGMATGDHIVKCDQDMTFMPGWLTECKRIALDPNVGLVCPFKYWHHPVDWRQTGIEVKGERGGEGYTYHSHICGSVMVIRRDMWEELGPFEEHSDAFAEDAMFQAAVFESGRACALPDEDLATNHGFGIGPSTVVEEGMKVHRIHHGPRLV